MSPLALALAAALAVVSVFGALAVRKEERSLLTVITSASPPLPRRLRWVGAIPLPRSLVARLHADPERRMSIANDLALSSNTSDLTPEGLLYVSAAIALLVLAVGAILALVSRLPFPLVLALAFFAAIAPYAAIHSRAKAVRQRAERQMPQLFDLLVLADSAGQSEAEGMRTAATRLAPPLGPLLSAALIGSARTGQDPVVVVGQLAQLTGSPALRDFVATLRLTQRHGGASYASALTAQADRLRDTRRMMIERKLNQLATLLNLPLGLFLVGILLTVVAGQLHTLMHGLAGV
jgi:Flp pilus assembly protein TadB